MESLNKRDQIVTECNISEIADPSAQFKVLKRARHNRLLNNEFDPFREAEARRDRSHNRQAGNGASESEASYRVI